MTKSLFERCYAVPGPLDAKAGLLARELAASPPPYLDGLHTTLLEGVHHSQSLGLLLVMTVLPCVLMFLSYILYQRKYKLDEEEYIRICSELEQRKA